MQLVATKFQLNSPINWGVFFGLYCILRVTSWGVNPVESLRHVRHIHILFLYLPFIPQKKKKKKKLQSAFWDQLWKKPFCNMKSDTGLWNYNYFSTSQWRPCPIWSNSHKEIWIFVKHVIGSFLPSFVTWMFLASTWININMINGVWNCFYCALWVSPLSKLWWTGLMTIA